MRVMVLGKATEDTKRGVLPTTAEFAAMEAFNEELARAGVLLAGEDFGGVVTRDMTQ